MPDLDRKPLYINSNGQIACAQHGGGYLQSSVQAYPRRKRHETPLGVWHRVDAADVQECRDYKEDPQKVLVCETCKSPTDVD